LFVFEPVLSVCKILLLFSFLQRKKKHSIFHSMISSPMQFGFLFRDQEEISVLRLIQFFLETLSFDFGRLVRNSKFRSRDSFSLSFGSWSKCVLALFSGFLLGTFPPYVFF
jgi:hypothetical protein